MLRKLLKKSNEDYARDKGKTFLQKKQELDRDQKIQESHEAQGEEDSEELDGHELITDDGGDLEIDAGKLEYDPANAPWDCNHRREIYQCSTQQLGERLGYFIANAKPIIKVLQSADDIEPFINNASYPIISYDVERQMMTTQLVCGAVAFNNMPSDIDEVR